MQTSPLCHKSFFGFRRARPTFRGVRCKQNVSRTIFFFFFVAPYQARSELLAPPHFQNNRTTERLSARIDSDVLARPFVRKPPSPTGVTKTRAPRTPLRSYPSRRFGRRTRVAVRISNRKLECRITRIVFRRYAQYTRTRVYTEVITGAATRLRIRHGLSTCSRGRTKELSNSKGLTDGTTVTQPPPFSPRAPTPGYRTAQDDGVHSRPSKATCPSRRFEISNRVRRVDRTVSMTDRCTDRLHVMTKKQKPPHNAIRIFIGLHVRLRETDIEPFSKVKELNYIVDIEVFLFHNKSLYKCSILIIVQINSVAICAPIGGKRIA